MKKSEFRSLIREEVRKVLKEGVKAELLDKVTELVKNLSPKEYKDFAFDNDINHRDPMEMQDFIQSLTDKEAEDIIKQFGK